MTESARCVCIICGAGGGGDLKAMPYNCHTCGGQKTVHPGCNSAVLPLTHDYFRNDCDCDQCKVWFKRAGTITNKLTREGWNSTEGDLTEVEAIGNGGKDHHDKLVDFLVALGPAKMYFVTSLIRTDETVTYRHWARRIRILGPVVMYNHFPEALTPEQLEELAVGVESLSNG
jgi:hypothetical protein